MTLFCVICGQFQPKTLDTTDKLLHNNLAEFLQGCVWRLIVHWFLKNLVKSSLNISATYHRQHLSQHQSPLHPKSTRQIQKLLKSPDINKASQQPHDEGHKLHKTRKSYYILSTVWLDSDFRLHKLSKCVLMYVRGVYNTSEMSFLFVCFVNIWRRLSNCVVLCVSLLSTSVLDCLYAYM